MSDHAHSLLAVQNSKHQSTGEKGHHLLIFSSTTTLVDNNMGQHTHKSKDLNHISSS